MGNFDVVGAPAAVSLDVDRVTCGKAAIGNAIPVTQDDSSLARQAAAFATSSGSPRRPSGWSAVNAASRSGSSNKARVSATRVKP